MSYGSGTYGDGLYADAGTVGYGTGTYGEGEYGDATAGVIVINPVLPLREKPPLRLSLNVESGGRHYRWADDEPQPDNRPAGLRFASTAPGGFADLDLSLARPPRRDYPDNRGLSDLTVHGPGGDTAWEGRIEAAPRSSGERQGVSIRAVGHQANMEDDNSASMVYVDRDLQRWGPVARALRVILLAAGYSVHDAQQRADNTDGTPALVTGWQGEWNGKPYSGSMYDAGAGNVIAYAHYEFTEDGGLTPSDAGWELYVQSATSDNLQTNESSGNLRAASGSGYFNPTTARRVVALEQFYSVAGAAGVAGTDYTVTWTNLAAYGDHGLESRGGDPAGFWASDVVKHAVDAWCPKLHYTDDSIVESSFVIPHLAFHEPTTPMAIVQAATRFGLQDWGVWDNKTVHWAPRGTFGRSWRARVGQAGLEETGQSTDRAINQVVVEYRDVDGSTRTVGPVGSGADTEDSSLEDTDPENPANRAGITRLQRIQMGVTTPAGAVHVGARFLEESRALDTSGRARFVGHVEDDRGVLHPAWRVRAGDTVTFLDAQDTSPRFVTAATYDHDARTVTVDLDAPPEGIQALMERLGVVTVPLGLN